MIFDFGRDTKTDIEITPSPYLILRQAAFRSYLEQCRFADS